MAERTDGPPWILGSRGVPLEAPENTRAGCAVAAALGLDGVAIDLRACASGEIVAHADADLERTTDHHGLVAERSWRDLADLDVGATFHPRFRGERLLLAEEVLALAAAWGQGASLLLHVHGPGVLLRLGPLVRELAPHASVRVAASERELVLAARDSGLAAMIVARELDERLLATAREDRPVALAAPVEAWLGRLGHEDWPTERWALDVDDPEELLAACRARLHGLTTREPRRARAARELAHLAPGSRAPWPLTLPRLEVVPESGSALAGDWSGVWQVAARIANPFPFDVGVTAGFVVRRGVFDVDGLPRTLELAPGAAADFTFTLSGGARRPGGDPLVVARLTWGAGPGREAGRLEIDAPLVRARTAVADTAPQRLFLLRDGPRDTPATLVLRRRAQHVTVALESPGRLHDPRVVVRLAGRTHAGARGVRVPLPDDFDERVDGVPFTCGLSAWQDGERVWRHWSGGLTDGADAGAPGRLRPRARA